MATKIYEDKRKALDKARRQAWNKGLVKVDMDIPPELYTQKRHPDALTPRKSVLKEEYGAIGSLECLTDRLLASHCKLYDSAIYTPARLSLFSSSMHLFV